MKTITIASRPPELMALFEQARDEDLVVRLADGSEFLLVAVDDFDHEIARSRANEKLMTFLDARARQDETIPLDEARRRLGL